jgi:hypothetical protein
VKLKIAGIASAAVLMVALCQSHARATTYDYVGNPYTSNANPGPGVLGTNLTGVVTFNFDTSSFTGALNSSDVSSLVMTSGTVNFDLTLSAATQFLLTNGSVTTWHLASATPPFFTGLAVGSDGNVLPAIGFQQNSVLVWSNGAFTGDGAFQSCSVANDPSCHLEGWSQVAETSATPLPAALPMFMGGAGLISLLARRRKRTKLSTVAA